MIRPENRTTRRIRAVLNTAYIAFVMYSLYITAPEVSAARWVFVFIFYAVMWNLLQRGMKKVEAEERREARERRYAQRRRTTDSSRY